MEEQKKEISWESGLDEEAMQRALQVGEILPQLPLPEIPEGKTTSEETLFVKFLEEPHLVESHKLPKGKAWFVEVEHQGVRKTIVVPDSLRFNLSKERRINKLDTIVGQYFVIGASLQDTKFRKNTKLYWCQLKKREPTESAPNSYDKKISNPS